MTKKNLDKSELKWTDSDYLCLFCYEPLYYNLKSKKEICANPNCLLYPIKPRIFRYDSNNPEIQKFKDQYKEILPKFYQFSKEFLFKRLYDIRAIEFHNFFQNKGLKLDHLLGIDYLLVLLSDQASWGNLTDYQLCDATINSFLKKYDDLKFLEEVELKIFPIDENHDVYMMKYHEVIMEIRKVLGIVYKDKHGPEDVNSFYFIDRQARVGEPKNPYDFETIFKNHYGLVITTNHLFKFGYFVSQIHKYPSKTEDLAMLFSLWPTCEPGKVCSAERHGLKEIYDGCMKVNNLTGNFDEFLEVYSSSKEYAPILIFDGSQYHYDYFTLFIFMFYVFSLNKTIEGTQTLSGFKTLNEQRKISSKTFEKVIRDKFRKEGYTVFPQNDNESFIKTFDGQEHEFDCIAIDYSKKVVVLVDAKYEDIAPSSTSGQRIVEQAVLDGHDGSLLHAKAQHERRRFFIKNFDNMGCSLNQFWNYRVISAVVCKHTPMIKKHLTTTLMSYNEFQNYDFRVN